jgi:hypothetical protein
METIIVKLNVDIEVEFKSYNDDSMNKTAKEQIIIWAEETLNEEDQVPLFVASRAGEESISKTITINNSSLTFVPLKLKSELLLEV